MARTWAITGPAKTELINGVGEAAFTITNQMATPMRGLVRIIPEGTATQEMFKVVGESTLDWGANETKQVTLQIDSKGAAVGTYVYSFAVVSETDPSELSDRISSSFDVVAPPVKKPFPVGALIGAVVGLLVVGGLIFFLLSRGGLEVPDLAGKTVQEAGELLTEEGLLVAEAVDLDAESDEDPGTVLDSDPPAGTSVEEGDEVTLVVAAGSIGDLVGSVATTAQEQLEAEGFTVEVVQQASTDPAGTVVAQDPPPGPVAPGQTIVLTVAIPEPAVTIPMPGLIGQSEAAARTLLDSADPSCAPDCVGEILTQYVYEVGNNEVTAQFPLEGELIAPGSPVFLTIRVFTFEIPDICCIYIPTFP